MSDSRFPPIAVIGLGALFPGSPGKAGFWSDILAGRDNISDVPPSHWLVEDYYDPDPDAPDKTYCRRGGFLSPVAFDPLQFGVPPTILPATDTAQLLALFVARQTLADAARTRHTPVDPNRTSVILGVASSTELVVQMNARLQRPIWRKSLREAGLPEHTVEAICDRIADHYVPWQEATFPGLLGNVVAGRISNRLDLGGSNFVTDAACASSLAAVQAGMHALYLGESDLVLCGGVDALNDILMFMCFSKTPAFSASGDCRPFAEAADGTIIGEGLGMLALRRLDDAERDGDAIYAVIRGLGASSDGRAASVYAPRAEGQARALERAYDNAGYSPATVELVEAHGTATIAGDAAEFQGLCTVFGAADEQKRNWCALGSVKSQIGHTKAAAGAAGLIKAVLALHHQVLPPTIKVDKVNPTLNIDETPFYINTEVRPWVRGADHPRRASVSSFGFGGSNFHITLEEYRGSGQRPPRLRSWPSEMMPLSAENRAELAAICRAMMSRGERGVSLAALAAETQAGFDEGKPCRVVVTAAGTAELSTLLERVARSLEAGNPAALSHPDIAYGEGERQAGLLAFLFPGQGSQYLGMGADLATAFPQVMAVWDMAASAPEFAELPLHDIVFPRPMLRDHPRDVQESQLTATINAQPALAAVSLAQLRLLTALGLRPDAVAGHSFGEVTALAAAGVLGEAQLLHVARLRGRLMADAAQRPGAMLAVSSERERVFKLMDSAAIDVVLANDNAPDQIVLAGGIVEIERAGELLGQAGIPTRRLPVATAFHSSIVASSCAPFRQALAGIPFAPPRVPVYANATTARYPLIPDEIRDRLAAQLAEPVQFRSMIDALYADGVRHFIEVGPGRVLTGLMTRCLDGRPHRVVALDDKANGGLRAWWRGLARLLADGHALNLMALAESVEAEAEAAPPPEHAVTIVGANYGRPYPPRDGGIEPLPPLETQSAATDNVPSIPPSAGFDAPAILSGAMASTPSPTAMPVFSFASPAVAEQPAHGRAVQLDDRDAIAMFHHETLVAHQHYQKLMAESHRNFLEFASNALAQLDGHASVAFGTSTDQRELPAHAPPPAHTSSESLTPSDALRGVERSLPDAMLEAGALDRSTTVDHASLLRRIVADKTGYPPDMLDLEMEMEAGLGIDSIKKVEILSALQEALPDLPPLKPAELATLRRLRDIVDRVESALVGDVIRPSAALQSRLQDDTALHRLVPSLVPADFLGFAMPALGSGSTVFVTNEAPAIATELVEGLKARGIPAQAVDTPPADASAVISLAGLAVEAGPEQALLLHLRVLRAARAVARSAEGRARLFVTVQTTGGRFGLDGNPGIGAWGAGVAGIAKTAALELPGACVKAIDLADSSQASTLILRELLEGGPELEVGFDASGQRVSIGLDEEAPDPVGVSTPLPQHAVLLVSGGARGVTARCVVELAKTYRLRLILLGRADITHWPEGIDEGDDIVALTRALTQAAQRDGTVLDIAACRAQARALAAAAEARRTLVELEDSGVDARYLSIDVTDADALAQALIPIRRMWGPIAGIIHGAGVLADRPIADLEDVEFAKVFTTKVAGFANLLSATQDDPLRMVAVFSSIAARYGNVGQAAYAAANEVLNKMMAAERARRGPACLLRAFNWGPWDGGMVDSGLKAHFESHGVALIQKDTGARFFVGELATASEATEIIAAASTGMPSLNLNLAREVGGTTQPYLRDHVVNGRAVLPIVLPLEWACRLGHAALPGHGEHFGLRDLQVLSGLTFAADLSQPSTLTFEMTPPRPGRDGPESELVLTGQNGRIHYRTTFLAAPGPLPTPFQPVPGPLRDWPCTVAEAYAGPLFHGPMFGVITALEGVSESGGCAMLRGTSSMDWPEEAWRTDPALLDGGMQLGVLWSSCLFQRPILPQRIGIYRRYAQPPSEAIRCNFLVRPMTDHHVNLDLLYTRQDGTPIAEIRDAEFYRVEA